MDADNGGRGLLIDVYIPTWNSERTLDRCLCCLYDNPGIKATLFDRYSQDRTVEIGNKYRVALVQGDWNLGEARTRMVEAATSDFIMLDSDVYVPSDWVSRLLAFKTRFNYLRLGAVQSRDQHSPTILDDGLRERYMRYAGWQEGKVVFPVRNPKRLDTNATWFALEAAKGFKTSVACYEDYLLGRYIVDRGYDCWAIDLPVIHNESISSRSLAKRCRIAGAWMRETGYSGLPRLAAGLIVSPMRAPSGTRTLCASFYWNYLRGWFSGKAGGESWN